MSFAIPVKKGLNGGMKQINFVNFFSFFTKLSIYVRISNNFGKPNQ